MAADVPFDVLRAHRWFAVEFNNAAWDVIEAAECSAEDQQRLKHLAHAACVHWSHTGTAVNRLRALCLLANVYSRVGPASEAVNFARQTAALSEQEPDGQTAFDRATAYDCLSRALTASGATEEAQRVRQRAMELAGLIEDSAERAVFDKLSCSDFRGMG